MFQNRHMILTLYLSLVGPNDRLQGCDGHRAGRSSIRYGRDLGVAGQDETALMSLTITFLHSCKAEHMSQIVSLLMWECDGPRPLSEAMIMMPFAVRRVREKNISEMLLHIQTDSNHGSGLFRSSNHALQKAY